MNGKGQNQNQSNSEQDLFRIKNTSSFLSLIAVLLSIEADQIDYLRINIKETQDTSDNLTLLSLFLSTIAAFIDLGTALYELDDIQNNIENENPLDVSAAKDLVTSRVLSIGAAILLIRATLKSIEAKNQGGEALTPSPGVVI